MDFWIAVAVAAQSVVDQPRTPFTYGFVTYLWVIMLSSMGGIISFWRNVSKGSARPFNLVELVGEMTTSAFVGLLTFWLCEWGKIDPMLSAVFIGVTGHMGSRALFAGEKLLEKYIYNKLGMACPPECPIKEEKHVDL